MKISFLILALALFSTGLFADNLSSEKTSAEPPADGDVCFSPVEPCDQKLLKFIEGAEKSIDIAIYDLNLDQIGHALLVKAKKIPVRIIGSRASARHFERQRNCKDMIGAAPDDGLKTCWTRDPIV